MHCHEHNHSSCVRERLIQFPGKEVQGIWPYIYWLSVVTSLSVVDNVSALHVSMCIMLYIHVHGHILRATCIPRKVALTTQAVDFYTETGCQKFHYSKIGLVMGIHIEQPYQF